MADAPLPEDPADAANSEELRKRVAAEQLRLVRVQISRLPWVNLVIESFIIAMAVNLGLWKAALAWALPFLAVQTWRYTYLKRLANQPEVDAPAVLKRLTAALLALGSLRAALLIPFFSVPLSTEHYVLTLMYSGLGAGAIGSVAGQLRAFLVWSGITLGTLALCWAWKGGPEGWGLSVLSVLFAGTLASYVREQRQSLRQLVGLALANEKLAANLRIERDRTEAASHAKTRFFAAANHDLRQPLHALAINATTLELLAKRQGHSAILELSQGINRALQQSNGLLDSLLDISKLDAKAVQPKLRRVDVVALLQGVYDEYAALAAHRGLGWELKLPSTRVGAVHTDPDLLMRVLSNLVGNALKFTEQGAVTLGAQLQADGRAVVLQVADTGPGIPPDEQSRVFEEFYQLGNESRDRSKGLGLGLSIVKRTAALIGAELHLESQVGQGTRITLSLPMAEAGGVPAARQVQAELPPLPEGLKVLVVDDEEEIRQSMCTLLRAHGCDARSALDLAGSVACVDAGFEPAMLLVDQRLQGGSGDEVIVTLRARLGNVPAMMITGDTDPRMLRAEGGVADRVLHKPVQGPPLMQAMRELWAQHSAAR